jgi:hypothetical protein
MQLLKRSVASHSRGVHVYRSVELVGQLNEPYHEDCTPDEGCTGFRNALITLGRWLNRCNLAIRWKRVEIDARNNHRCIGQGLFTELV